MTTFTHPFATLLLETYIRPFSSPKRCLSYLGVFLGVFGFNLILIAMPLSYSNASYTSLLIFYVALFAPMGLLFFPFFYTGASTVDTKWWRIGLMTVQLLCFLPLLVSKDNLYITGFFCAFISTVFWGFYHIAMMGNTTPAKRSFQVVLGDNLVIISSALAALMAVHYTGPEYRTLILLIACFAMFISNLCQSIVSPYFYDSRIKTFWAKTRVTLRQNNGLMLRILQRSLLATPDFILPAVLYFLHYSLTAIGAFIIIRTIIQTVLSPFIALMIRRKGLNEYAIGLGLCALGWAVFYLADASQFLLMVFLILNATGLRILNNSITVRLYRVGNYGGLMMNEIFLGLSRAMMLGILIPLLFFDPHAYIMFMAVCAVAILLLEGLIHIVNRRARAKIPRPLEMA